MLVRVLLLACRKRLGFEMLEHLPMVRQRGRHAVARQWGCPTGVGNDTLIAQKGLGRYLRIATQRSRYVLRRPTSHLAGYGLGLGDKTGMAHGRDLEIGALDHRLGARYDDLHGSDIYVFASQR